MFDVNSAEIPLVQIGNGGQNILTLVFSNKEEERISKGVYLTFDNLNIYEYMRK